MKKKAYLFVSGCLLTLMFLWAFLGFQTNVPQLQFTQPHSVSKDAIIEDLSTQYTQPHERWKDQHSVSKDVIVDDLSAKDYLSEEALKFEPLTNVQDVVSMKQSTVKILGKTKTFSVGDTIVISITLKEASGTRRTRGGDKLHVRILNTTYDAYAPGYVIDHDNGTYTAEVPAIWPGRSIISVYLAHPREIIRSLYATMRERFTTRDIFGRYESGEEKEEVLCQPAREYFTHSEDVCNLTKTNGGMAWYCEKPRNEQLLCDDWKSVKAPMLKGWSPTDEEMIILSRGRGEKNMTVFITGSLLQRNTLPDCSSVSKRATWVQHKPSGFFYQGRWNLNFCNLPRDDTFGECLRGKNLSILGDSTTRQWYTYMREHLKCTQVTEEWTEKKWRKRSMCKNRDMNFTVTMIPHAQPHYGGEDWKTKDFTTHSIAAYLDESSVDSNLVVVIHMFAHFIYYRSEIFRDRMKAISSSARHLLDRNKDVMILVKGPHTYSSNIRNYMYYVYRDIIKEEFKGLYDRVVFMEQGDITIVKKNKDLHPAIDIVKESVRQLIGYIC